MLIVSSLSWFDQTNWEFSKKFLTERTNVFLYDIKDGDRYFFKKTKLNAYLDVLVGKLCYR